MLHLPSLLLGIAIGAALSFIGAVAGAHVAVWRRAIAHARLLEADRKELGALLSRYAEQDEAAERRDVH
jgi:hypothetical protein